MTYKTLYKADYENLLRLIGDEKRVLFGDGINEEYSHDELGGIARTPDIVIKARSTDDVSAVMKYAYENSIPVTPRGSGTGLVGSCVPVHGGITLDMSGMNKVLELDSENLTITVEPGILLMELAQYVEGNGFFYPPDPGEKTATIGGNISTNAGGMRAVKYGVTRDYVRGLEIVMADGTVTFLGGKNVKDSSGYALKDMIIGSEGTLAVVTKAILKLLPLPQKTISLLVPFPDLKSAIGTVPQIIGSKCTPTAVEFMQKEVILDAESYLGSKFPDSGSDAYLLLKFDGGSRAEVEKNYETVARICLENGAPDIFISDTEERDETIWKARGAFLEAIKASTSLMDEVDVVVPRNCVDKLVEFSHSLEKKHGIRIKSFGHAGDGNLHIYLLKDNLSDSEWETKKNAAMQEMYEKANSFGGKVSGEHGIGWAKKEYLKSTLDSRLLDVMKGIKNAFDPKNILNPNKIFY